MSAPLRLPPQLELPAGLLDLLVDAAAAIVADKRKASHSAHRARKGGTIRPGRETPLWNVLAAEIRPHLSSYGAQANLGRVLGLSRQQINAFFTRRTRMPDAERTLQLLAWLMAVRQNRPPS
ncbi:MAG: hypothetical protein PHE83_14215 [Opitutaceae bacterium]|nr:hypothetical protein [Opitutaceae bacterium]